MKIGTFKLLILLCTTILQVLSSRQAERQVRINVESDSTIYFGEVADFGNQFLDPEPFSADLMPPPDDNFFCEFPPSLLNMTRKEAQKFLKSQRDPIALLVSRGKCNFFKKAQVALEMRQQFSDQLRYLIVYDNMKSNQLIRMSAEDKAEFASMGFIFISADSGKALLEKKDGNVSVSSDPNYYFLGKLEQNWRIPLTIQGVNKKPHWVYSRKTFHWLRFVLFTLLILSPCIRAGILWYRAGGRITIRHNDDGRIRVQFVRPMPYWFASGLEAQDETDTNILTEEEVAALPEIIYRTKGKDQDSINNANEKESPQIKKSIDSASNSTKIDVQRSDSIDVEQPLEKVDKGFILTLPRNSEGEEKNMIQICTTCTLCSICIEDFEVGERIKVLPQCKHAFHAECIKPWLTERQGCCPLCKVVIKPREGSVEPEDNET